MDKVILYKNNDGGISIIYPADECGLSIYDIALKDVPAGIGFNIVDRSILPRDRTFRDAWEADFTQPDGYGIGHEAWFAQQKEKEDYSDNN